MVRDAFLINDTFLCLHRLVKSKNGASPWDRWDYYPGFPNLEILAGRNKPVIYFETPLINKDNETGQLGGKNQHDMLMTIGTWDDRKNGGKAESEIMISHLFDFFNSQEDCNTKTFSVTLGATTYADKTLLEMGLAIIDVQAPTELPTSEFLEFRNSLIINITRN